MMILRKTLTMAVVLPVLAGCGDASPPVVTYTEQVLARPGTSRPAASATGPSVAWTVPEGWVDLGPASARLATLRHDGYQPAAEIQLAAFPGRVGGVRANLERWLRQLELPTDAATVDRLEKHAPKLATAGGWPALWVDFRELATATQHEQALLGAMVFLPEHMVYVKMTAPVSVLDAEEAAIRTFILSLAPKEAYQ